MKTLKKTLLPIMFFVVIILSIFFIELFLNVEQTKLLMLVAFIVTIVSIFYGLIQSLAPKSKLKFFRGRKNGVLLIASVTLFFIFTMYISSYNMGIYEAFQEGLTAFEKMEMYKTLNISLKGKRQYSLNIESHIKEMNVEDIKYASIYYDMDIAIGYVNAIKESLQRAETINEKIFGDFQKEPLRVILYGKEENFIIDGFESDLIQGYFDGENIHIKVFEDSQNPFGIEHIFIHEYTHYAFDRYLYINNIFDNIPTWFNEGIAEYACSYGENRTYSISSLENKIGFKSLETTKDFNDAYHFSNGEERSFDPYIYSYYMIDSLVSLKGEAVIKDILLQSIDMDFHEAFKEIVGVDIEEYENIKLVEYIEDKSLN